MRDGGNGAGGAAKDAGLDIVSLVLRFCTVLPCPWPGRVNPGQVGSEDGAPCTEYGVRSTEFRLRPTFNE